MIGRTGLKSAVLSTVIFNLLIISEEGLKGESIIILFISFIILTVISFIAITLTIYPIYLLSTSSNLTKKQVFTKYFPYYSMFYFTISIWFYYLSNFENFGLLIGVTIFFTAMFAWVWLFSNMKNNN